MPPNQMETSKETLASSMASVVRLYHPSLRAQITSLKRNFARLILKAGPQQQEWISIYRLFFKLSSGWDDHMFHEETFLFPELEALEKAQGTAPDSSITVPLQKMEEEHHVLLRQWKVLQESVKFCAEEPVDEELVEEVRLGLDNLEQGILKHQEFESKMVYGKAKSLFQEGEEP